MHRRMQVGYTPIFHKRCRHLPSWGSNPCRYRVMIICGSNQYVKVDSKEVAALGDLGGHWGY